MVELYVGGERVGTLAEAEALLPELVARNARVEFRDAAGNRLGTFTPERPRDPNEALVPWDPTITREELDRRAIGPGLTIDEVRKRMGWA